jgi:hypothetical protein
MKFNLIKNVVGAIAPTLGSALGGPLGGQAASVVAQVLGCSPEPKAINQAIQSAHAEQMLELKKAEQQFEVQMKELDVDIFKLEAADKKDARGNLAKIGLQELWVLLLLVDFLAIYF